MSFTAVPIDEFIKRRRQGIESAKAAQSYNPNMIVVDVPDDEIICDVCNADIEIAEGVVWLNSYGAYCSECRRKHA